MRLTKKTVILAIALLAIITGTVFGTVAYLTDTEKVTNTFSIGKVGIDVDETVVGEDGKPVQKVDENGNPVVDENGEPVYERTEPGTDGEEGNTYPMIPGATYVKDPTMTVDGDSEPSYFRMMVTLNCMDKILEILGEDFLPQDFVNGWDASIWPCAKIIDNSDNTRTYEFRYAGEKTTGKLEPLFTELKIPTVFDGDDVEALKDFAIIVEGNAIQKTGFEDAENSEDTAWAAFDDQMAATAQEDNQNTSDDTTTPDAGVFAAPEGGEASTT